MSAVSVFPAFDGIVNVLLSTAGVPLVKVIAPSPDVAKVQVRSVKVATPATAGNVDVPPIVQVPVPAFGVATTLAVAEGPVAQVLLYWSFRVTTGCVANASPLAAPGAGCWVTVRLATAPAVMVCATVESSYPVAATTTFAVAGVLRAALPPPGLSVIFPLDTT